jgi:hypothetical protein
MRALPPIAALGLLAAACGPDVLPGGSVDPGGGGGGSGVPGTFSSIEADLLVPRCATSSCHSGNPPPVPVSLDAGLAYGELVGKPSIQVPQLNLVEPGMPERSYLVIKLRGSAGMVGAPMPLGDSALDEADIESIEAWIANGAPND